MSILNFENTMNKLGELVKEWSGLFGGKSPFTVQFSVTPDGLLSVNGICLCPVSEVDAEASVFDVEYFHIYLHSGSYYEIYIHCPFEGQPEIGYIHLISTVYSAESL